MPGFGRKRVLVIGGNAAGMTAASRLRRLDPQAEILVLERSCHISYSICGAPYYLEGLIAAPEELLAFTPATLESERGIRARTEWEATELSLGRRDMECRDLRTGLVERLSFDNLVLATGYRPAIGAIEGAEHPAVFKISQLEDAVRLNRFIETRRPAAAVIVGAGYIGLNMAEALVKRGVSVRVMEREEQIFRALDPEIASLVEQEFRSHGIEISCFAPVSAVVFDGESPSGVVAAGRHCPAELVLVDVGVVPEVGLAAQSGLRIGLSGGIAVSSRMETSQDGIYAAGNCAETTHRITKRPITSALGTHAVKQGRVAGENIAGMRSEFAGVLQTSITRFFSLSVARTGLNEREARGFGYDFVSASARSPARAAYFPPKEAITVKLLADRKTATLLGAQIAGSPWTTKRIDVVAAAIAAGMELEEFAQIDMAYSPPHGPLWDPLLVAANLVLRQLR